MSFHTLILVGNLGKEPEMRYTASGRPVTNFSVAVASSSKDPDGNFKKETIWFRVSAWDKQAENCNNFLHKGSKVVVEGRLQHDEKGNPRTFKRQDGTSGSSFDVIASTVRFLSSKGEGGGEQPSSDEGADIAPNEEDSIPF